MEEEDILNLLKNSIPNDQCKMFCIPAIEETKKTMKFYYRTNIFIYCVVYELEYFINELFKIHKKDNSKGEDDIEFAYLYYLQSHNQDDTKLKEKLVEKYKTIKKKVQQEIDSLKTIKFDVLWIKRIFRNNGDNDLKNNRIMGNRISIINTCMKYKILSKELELRYNEQIDKILNRNVKLLKKCNYIEDKLYLI